MAKKKPVQGVDERPSIPVMVSAEVQPDMSVVFAWEPPTVCDPPLKKYMLWLDPAVGSSTLTDLPPTMTSCSATGLTPNMLWEVGVYAQNADGGSKLSNLIPFRIDAAPQAPRLNSAVPSGTAIVCKWSNVQISSLVRLQAVIRVDGSESVYRLVDLSTSAMQGNITGLPSGKYQISLVAQYVSVGKSGESNRVGVDFQPAPAPVPLDTPVLVSLTGGDSSAVAVWSSSDVRVVRQVVDVYTATRLFGSFDVDVRARSFTVVGLANLTEYRVSVTVFSDVDSASSNVLRVTPKKPVTPPEAPVWGSLTSDEVASATARWDSVTGATSYKVTWRDEATKVVKTAVNVTGTSYTARLLTKGGTYTFWLNAVNSAATSVDSTVKTVVVKDDTPAPLPKPTVTATPSLGGQADINWTVDTDSRLTGFTVTILDSKGSVSFQKEHLATVRTSSVVGLTEGSVYTVTVTAKYGTATMASDSVDFTEPVTPIVPPNPIKGCSAEQKSVSEIWVYWTPPTDGGTVDNYLLTITNKTTNTVYGNIAYPANQKDAIVFATNQKPWLDGDVYEFSFVTKNSVGTSTPVAITVKVANGPTPVPVITSVVNNPETVGQADITFTYAGDAGLWGVDSWVVEYQAVGDTTWTEAVYPMNIVGVLGLGNLPVNKTYNVRMYAKGHRDSDRSNMKTVLISDGLPAKVKGLSVTQKAPTEMWTYWTPDLSLGNVTGFVLVVKDETQGVEHGRKTYPANQKDTIYTTQGGFIGDHVYSFTMTQTNKNGAGPATVFNVTADNPIPNQPTVAKVEQMSATEMAVTWLASPVGGVATTFNLTVRDNLEKQNVVIKKGLTGSSLNVVNNWRDGVTYTVSLTAVNAKGESVAATKDITTTLDGKPPMPVITNIYAIQNFLGAVDMEWSYEAADSTKWAIKDYGVEWAVVGTENWTRINTESTIKKFSIRTLEGGVEYQFRIRAQGAHLSDWTAVKTVTTWKPVADPPVITDTATPAKGTLDFTMVRDDDAEEVIVSVTDKNGDQFSYHAVPNGDHKWEISAGKWRAGECTVSASPVHGGGTTLWSEPIVITLK